MKRIATALMILALASPAAAGAAARRPATLAPPGNSALTQYLETVPTDAGSKPPPSSGQPQGGLSPGQRASLDRLGPDGKVLANVVAATAQPADSASGGHRAGGKVGARRTGAIPAAAPSPRALIGGGGGASSPVSSILAAATGRDSGGGVGLLLPMVMVAVLLAVTLSAWRRRAARDS